MPETYVVTGQAPDMELNDAGSGFVQGWKVTYRVTSGPAKGTVGTVFVPNSDHNADYVSTEIAAKVKDLTDISSLGS